jgi:hypothetical protein
MRPPAAGCMRVPNRQHSLGPASRSEICFAKDTTTVIPELLIAVKIQELLRFYSTQLSIKAPSNGFLLLKL